ncbi:MAG: hypothetical protein CR982_06040 [Candidatus Cloacimonadota bacterium]|nr:MAG: hypothetical protein CR982_06040 [Candidatus Cloacimonadota bacterium]PIE78080.1 MAG: hypothetical protein CSA15_09600 [Candidatus Delongbacteria bacterium]
MNILKIIIILLGSIAYLSASQVKHNYSFSKNMITESSSKLFANMKTVRLKGGVLSGKIGAPALPYYPVSLLLPKGEKGESITINRSGKIEIEGSFNLEPMQGSKPISSNKKNPLIKDNSIYNSNYLFPKYSGSNLSTSYMNGYSVALSTFTPFEYNPRSGKLYMYQDVEVIVESSKDQESKKALENLNSSSKVIDRVKLLVQNDEMIDSYGSKTYPSESYQVAIISEPSFDFSNLIDLYNERGIKTVFTNVNEIYSEYEGVDDPEKIRNFIIDEYQNRGVSYILLGGDTEIIPVRGFFCEVQSAFVYTDESIPSDLYYSALDGSWNEDGDNLWGEIGEDDLLPDISVGRLSFSTQNELNNMINKSVTYQNSPIVDEIKKPLLVGEYMYNDPETWGADYMNLLIGEHDDNGYTTIGIPEDYNIQKLYDKDVTWSPSELRDLINSGTIYLNHCGHSNYDYTMKMYNSDIVSSNFSGANGTDHSFPVLYSHGCICGAFDYDDCIAEKMVTLDNFATAFICNSRYGWFNEGQTEGPSQHLNREFLNAVYGLDKSRIGEAHMISKIASSPWVNAPGQHEEGALRWCFYDSNLLGDPTLSMWTNNPVTPTLTHNPIFYITGEGSEVTITDQEGNPIQNVDCGIIIDGNICGWGISNSEGVAEIEYTENITSGNGILVVSGNNTIVTTSNISIQETGIDENIANSVTLYDNYPNPFNPSTTIKFSLPNLGMVNLSIFNTKGELVKTLLNRELDRGVHSYNFEAEDFNSGLYFYRLTTEKKSITKKMIFVK